MFAGQGRYHCSLRRCSVTAGMRQCVARVGEAQGLRLYSSHARSQTTARVASAIVCLAMDDDTESALVRADALPLLVAALRLHISVDVVVDPVARALQNLSSQARHKPIALGAGVVPLAVDALRRPERTAVSIKPLADLIHVLVSHRPPYGRGDVRAELERTGAPDVVSGLIGRYRAMGDDTDAEAAVAALSDLQLALDDLWRAAE